jgi:hypothetical protein
MGGGSPPTGRSRDQLEWLGDFEYGERNESDV